MDPAFEIGEVFSDLSHLQWVGDARMIPIGDSAMAAAINAFQYWMKSIFGPIIEEKGRQLAENYRVKRENARKIAEIAREQVEERTKRLPPGQELKPPFRLFMKAMEDGSWSDDETIQEMWAGLLSGSCTADGKNESNLIFMHVLGQLTGSEVRLLRHACLSWTQGSIDQMNMVTEWSEVCRIGGYPDESSARAEIEHMRMLGLFHRPDKDDFLARARPPELTPPDFAVLMYLKCEGDSRSLDQIHRDRFDKSKRPEQVVFSSPGSPIVVSVK